MTGSRILVRITRNLGPRGIAGVATAAYVLLGLAWILPSDPLVTRLASDQQMLEQLQTAKGLLYVAVTGALLYVIVLLFARALGYNRTQLEQQREHLAQLNRAHATLNSVSEALLHGSNDQFLLDSTARAIVEEGGFPFVWIGLFEPDSRRLTPRAAARTQGLARSVADPFVLTSADRSIVAHAIFRGQMSHVAYGEDRRVDRLAPPGIEYAAVAAFPLRGSTENLGVIVIHTNQATLFEDEDEVRLLTRVADTLSLGLAYSDERRMLHQLDQHDPVTGVGTRGFVESRLGAALNNAAQRDSAVAVMVLDIDDFRRINDTGGRDAGDRVLAAVVRCLAGVVRPGDSIGRIGNDEFALVCQDFATIEQASRLVSRVADRFPEHIDIDGEETRITVSIGVAMYPDDARDAAELLSRAELALHSQPEGQVGGITWYAPEFDRRASEQRTLETALRKADFEREFRLLWQPIVDPRKRELRAAEVLLRWHNAELGEIPPDRFIPLAERSGQIRALGRWVLENACAQARAWADAGRPVDIAVNIALEQLQDPDFVPHVEELLQTADRGWTLTFELTESQFMAEPEPVIETCRRLRALGCRIHLDDFGTGYSALHYLVHLPLDGLKIDRSFIRRIETDSGVRAITRAVVSLATQLELEVIAEGVETDGQLRIVNEIGGCMIQGYYFGRPMEGAQLSNWTAAAVSQPGNRVRGGSR
ncbi:MAG: EAL domain-containing protein [Halofilum sp. (in: g-proteobacteria)]|nr:EAL domain-containing protein [Halofilum sp. (in: g-proteobacteria)]